MSNAIQGGATAMEARAGISVGGSAVVHIEKPDGSVEVTMFMSQNGFDLLQSLARDAGASLEDVIGRSLVLYRDARKAVDQGKAVGVTSDPETLDIQFIDL